MNEMNEIDNMIELSKIGGKTMYDLYCSKIKEYLRENPGKTEREIAIEAEVPFIAVRRAIREGVLEYVKDKGFVDKDEHKNKVQNNRKKLLKELNAAFNRKLPTRENSTSKLVGDLEEMKSINSKNQLGWEQDR